MMDTIRAIISNWLDPIGVVLGLFALVPIYWTWWDVVWGRRRRQHRWLREARREPGARPAILVIDLLPGKDVRAQVEHFVADNEALREIPPDRRFYLGRQEALSPDAVTDFVSELRQKAAADIARAGCDTVHLFYAGPLAGAAIVGAEFANGARCLFYQHQQGRYENYGPLRYS
jgi:hypothetical protein